MSWRGSPRRIRSGAGAEGSLSRTERRSTMGGIMRHLGQRPSMSRRSPERRAARIRWTVPPRPQPSIAGQRLRRFETYFDAAFEGLVVRLGFAAREALTHGLDDHPLARHTGFFQLERDAIGPLLRQGLVQL